MFFFFLPRFWNYVGIEGEVFTVRSARYKAIFENIGFQGKSDIRHERKLWSSSGCLEEIIWFKLAALRTAKDSVLSLHATKIITFLFPNFVHGPLLKDFQRR